MPRRAVTTRSAVQVQINATFAELGLHYGCAILPARPRKPRDKAAVEAGVLLAQRWILACLRHERFHSLGALNARIRALLDRLNTRPFQKREGCRREVFETLDRPAMKPLPRSASSWASGSSHSASAWTIAWHSSTAFTACPWR